MKIGHKGIFASLVALAALASASIVRAQLPDLGSVDTRYGAIAVSADGSVYGVATDYTVFKEAKSAADRSCQQKSGGACKSAIAFQDICGALAGGEGGKWAAAQADYREDARNAVLAECQKDGISACKVEVVACAGDS